MREAGLPVLNLVFMCLFQAKALKALHLVSLNLTTGSSPCHFSDSSWPQPSETVTTQTRHSLPSLPVLMLECSCHITAARVDRRKKRWAKLIHPILLLPLPGLCGTWKQEFRVPATSHGRYRGKQEDRTHRKEELAHWPFSRKRPLLFDWQLWLWPLKSVCFGRNLESG